MTERNISLDALQRGQSAVITSVRGRGAMRAHLRDLGFVEQCAVTCLYSSVFGDPRAYRVKDAVIALRDDDAKCVGCKYVGGTL